MDRAEIFGFGAALGGHALLLGVFALGLMASAKTAPKPESISVSLVGEIADVSSAPDAIQEESAPPAAGETAPAEPPPAPTPVMQVEKPQTKPVPKPAKAETAQSVAKAAPKPLNTAAAAPPKTNKAATVSGKGTTPTKPGGLSRSFDDSINTIGKASGAGKAVGTPAAKTATEVRRAISVSVNSEVRGPWNACKFSGVDVNLLNTVVKFELNRDGTLKRYRSVVTTGQNESNKFQVSRHQECAKLAIGQASPFSLPNENYDFWKDYELEFFKK
jgi:hypothetical protein